MISRVKHVFKRYGRTAFIFHSTIFVTTLAGSYAAIQRGVDLQALAKRVPILDLSKLDPDAGTLALAYVSTVATGPARCVLTVAASPIIARFLVRGAHLTNTNKMTPTRRRFPKQ
ncbi:hypothetical protein PC129_g21590 [Phytophthora cactorum]|uniref:DUF1279 domain-containing protein n=1 Tax=Phytophthora cactorum TaxID=29920 RepID=A0A8T1FZ53_9STRA|nr:hypothetical protein Pcac1_g13056 [Phytophthora cactorum]KAG2840969.1 hypothetical protein PC112_g3556 [Phytophthora cactorum]KAG2842704.1 hypothetical protein PC111_g2617 [Phytophthora cactorum]KAG2865434.1 hypothetical protein PC113_g3715 [Phytophthora cactorum]KAG2901938.1 hypothetical protein PC114_g12943 [Phytophthora cactorum]